MQAARRSDRTPQLGGLWAAHLRINQRGRRRQRARRVLQHRFIGPEAPAIRTMQTPPFKHNPIASGYSLAFAMASKHEAVVTRQGIDVKLITLEKGEEMHAFDDLGMELSLIHI